MKKFYLSETIIIEVNALLKNQKQERRSVSFKIAGWAQVALLGWMMAWGDYSSRLEYVAVGTARIDCAIAQPEVPTKGEPSGSERVNPTQCDGYGALPGTMKASPLIAGANVASQLGWRGHYIDPTGFYYMGARNYAPDSGTFLSPDPLGHSASMDLYSYCDGDPVNQYDADGRVGKAAVNYDGFRNVADLYSVSNVSWQSGNYLSAVGGYTAATAVGGGLVVDTVLNATGVGEVINLGLDALKVGFKKGGEFLASQLEKNVVTDAGKTGAGVADDAFSHGLKYDPRVRARGVQDPSSHNFPYSFDDGILAAKPIPQKNGYNIFQQPGSIAGKVITDPKTGIRTQTYKDGVFEIGVTKDGVIDHRFFRPN